MPPPLFAPGAPFLRENYTVDRFLGAGYSGEVYALTHRHTGDHFAAKVMHLADRTNARKVARALVQARAAYRIRHHNVTRMVDLGCEEDGTVWQIMELLEGRTIAELLRRFGRFSPLFALEVAIEIAWGLTAAHELQIIHRDIKPANVILTSGGVVKVLDFSLAKIIPEAFQTTQGKVGMGTTAYMAPENLRGDPPTPQFDVYSLGVMLWQMLAGQHPFERALNDADALIEMHLNVDPELLSKVAGLPAVLDEITHRAMAKAPGRRYAGMWPMAQAMLAAHEHIRRDPGAAWAAMQRRPWEVAIARDPSGHSAYSAPAAATVFHDVPAAPAERVVVSESAERQPSLAPAAPAVDAATGNAALRRADAGRERGRRVAGLVLILVCFAVGLAVALALAMRAPR